MIINESSGVFNQAEITVSDLTGKQILNSTLISFNNSSLQLDVSMLHPGFYILSFATGDKLRQLKFVKN
ncbi:MAG: T9SS type A sorting domain-containing protein [Bacteroidetes bacterium]|nr:T9SS type A sorting domain-containing protein [Bacteroidota bacterium]